MHPVPTGPQDAPPRAAPAPRLPLALRGFLSHLRLTLRLGFASPQALAYGYVVPVLFLVAFGAVFRAGHPPLAHQMGQLLTIGALGGACLAMPTTLVGERERGWWRRYRLLPGALAPLVASTLVARFILMAGAGALQVVLAHAIYGTPWPSHPAHLAAAYVAAAFAFLGLGLLVAALARDVPSAQALGQCLFLPLIMVGGVVVPLAALPAWAARLASFLPGRYAVDALGTGYSDDGRGLMFRLNLAALVTIGAAASVAGLRLFRWDSAQAPARAAKAWTAAALIPWIAVGLLSLRADLSRDQGHGDPSLAITEAQISSITFTGLPPDDGTVTPLAPPVPVLGPRDVARMGDIRARLAAWPPGRDASRSQAIRNLLSAAAVADVAEDPLEGAIARAVLDHFYAHFDPDELERGLSWVVLYPDAGQVPTSVPELGIPGTIPAAVVRERDALYAAKFLGRVRGRIGN